MPLQVVFNFLDCLFFPCVTEGVGVLRCFSSLDYVLTHHQAVSLCSTTLLLGGSLKRFGRQQEHAWDVLIVHKKHEPSQGLIPRSLKLMQKTGPQDLTTQMTGCELAQACNSLAGQSPSPTVGDEEEAIFLAN